MRGTPTKQATMQTLLSPEQRVRADHPLREIKRLTDEALRKMSPLFEAMYSTEGRPSIPPETLLKASLLMALYSVRSERLFCEQLDYNLMFRYFLEMSMVENSFNHSTFSKNRERLLKHEVARVFFGEIVSQVQSTGLMSDEHFTVDGTLIEAWASLKSFRPKGEKPEDRPKPDDPDNPSAPAVPSASRSVRWTRKSKFQKTLRCNCSISFFNNLLDHSLRHKLGRPTVTCH